MYISINFNSLIEDMATISQFEKYNCDRFGDLLAQKYPTKSKLFKP